MVTSAGDSSAFGCIQYPFLAVFDSIVLSSTLQCIEHDSIGVATDLPVAFTRIYRTQLYSCAVLSVSFHTADQAIKPAYCRHQPGDLSAFRVVDGNGPPGHGFHRVPGDHRAGPNGEDTALEEECAIRKVEL